MKNTVFLRALRVFSRGATSHHHQAPHTDSVQSTVQRTLGSAGINPGANRLADIGATIERALSAAGLTRRSSSAEPERVTATVLSTPSQAAFEERLLPTLPVEPSHPGEFVCRSFTGHAGTRTYKLYIPSNYRAQADTRMPLVVMLHGCTQSPDDFAAGTGMNALAEQQGFLVAYPEQAGDANPSRCWNWFRSGDQQRDAGEPSLIAGITREITAAYRIDPRRVYVAGLSAGAAMAVVLGATYPELYAAVGAHSGLSYAAAHDIPSAFAAMKNGGTHDSARHRANLTHHGVAAVPTIVFHGDSDATVTSRNAKAIVEQAVGAHGERAPLLASSQEGVAAGRRYVRIVYSDGVASNPRVEHWTIRGGGHAWSGGSPAGSYTDAQGPNASAEMIRFFLTHTR